VNEDLVYSKESLDKVIALRNLKGNDVSALQEPTDYKHKNYHVKWPSTWARNLAEYQDIAAKKGVDAANAFDATTKCRTALMRMNRMLNILLAQEDAFTDGIPVSSENLYRLILNSIKYNKMIIPPHLETIAMLATHGERLKATRYPFGCGSRRS
jgi:hypothetical protein